MADLVTHGITAALVRGARRPDASLLWLVTGVLLPDLLSRAPLIAVRELHDCGLTTPVPISSDRLLIGMEITHTPVGMVLVALLVALVLPRAIVATHSRLQLAVLIGGGGFLHLGVDLMQRHVEPGYYLVYPLSVSRWELGWFRSDGSVLALPVLAALWLALNYRWLREMAAARGRARATPQWEE